MEIDLAAEIVDVIEQKVAAGQYPSATALVEEALFLLVERDWQEAQGELHKQTGLFSGPPQSNPFKDVTS